MRTKIAALAAVVALGSSVALTAPATAAAPAAAVGCTDDYNGPHPQLSRATHSGFIHEATTHVQCLLTNWHNIPTGIDGYFGSETERNVIKLQKRCYPNSPAEWDGIVGPNTWKALHPKEAPCKVA